MAIRSKKREASYDFVVIGGGMAGICAALAGARSGARTALINDRPVLGGCASPEVRMHISGASDNMKKPDADETGIILEILLENKAYNDSYNHSIWGALLLQKLKAQENLTLYLNTAVDDLEMDGACIRSVTGYQSTTETRWQIYGSVFADCTGNGTVGYMAGAEYRTGCEGKAEFGEPDAPDEPNQDRMGNTLLYKAVDRHVPVPYKAPPWIRKFTEEDLKDRPHANRIEDMRKQQKRGDASCLDYGYWWIEIPGTRDDIIDEYEEIRDELVRCIYGIWDHIKNGGDHGAETYDLLWIGMLPGMRESRRLVGDYILTENDIFANRIFEDAVAYGGWPIDNHSKGGLFHKGKPAAFLHHFDGLYTIPYRCYCNKDIPNLMQGGRLLSASKLAMASTRVMGTCSIGGQAIGTAAGLCIKYRCLPKEIAGHMKELQQQLLKDDCFIPGYRNEDPADLARRAAIRASSELEGSPAENVLNGVSRNTPGQVNCWESDGISGDGETLELQLEKETAVSEVRVTFDSNLNRAIKITLSDKLIGEQLVGVPPELVKDYELLLFCKDRAVYRQQVRDNYQRLNVLAVPGGIRCDRIVIHVQSTNGYPNARIFELRAYANSMAVMG